MTLNGKLVRIGIWVVLGAILVYGAVNVLAGYGLIPGMGGSLSGKTEWQAVFLTNNQVYFGSLSSAGGDLVLKKVFYLRVSDPLQPGSANPELNLVKLGGELHGPEDAMFIPKSSVIFWENLKSDSQVVRAIDNFLKK